MHTIQGVSARVFIGFLFCFIALICAPVDAGTLNGHLNAFNNGDGPSGGAWTGTATFERQTMQGLLKGELDFAVFTAADFEANFGSLGYTAGDALVYTYQVKNTGAVAISAEIIGIVNDANTIGSFNIGEVQPTDQDFIPNAWWQFLTNKDGATGNGVIGITPATDESWGLAFSSPNVPMPGLAITIDGGTPAFSTGVPTPSAVPIPEPSTLVLLGFGVVTLCCWMRRSR